MIRTAFSICFSNECHLCEVLFKYSLCFKASFATAAIEILTKTDIVLRRKEDIRGRRWRSSPPPREAVRKQKCIFQGKKCIFQSKNAFFRAKMHFSEFGNFRRLFLGCIGTSDSESRRIFQDFSKSTRSAFFCTVPNPNLQQNSLNLAGFRRFPQNFAKYRGNFSKIAKCCYNF